MPVEAILSVAIDDAIVVSLTDILDADGQPAAIDGIDMSVVPDTTIGIAGTVVPFKKEDDSVDPLQMVAYPPDSADPDPAAVTVYQVDPDALIGPGKHLLPALQFGVHWTPREAASAKLNLGNVVKKSTIRL